MKNILLAIILLAGIHTVAFAQCDPQFGSVVSTTYTGTSVSAGGVPTILVGQTGQLHFSFGVGTDPACDGNAGNTPGSITITLSFTNNYAPVSEASITGSQAALYDWFYDASTKTLIGTNNAPIPVGALADFTVDVVGLIFTDQELAPLTTLNWFSDSNPPISNGDTDNDIRSVGLNVDTALPVKLVSFTANKEGVIATLNWTTTEETNSDYFEIQRSGDGHEWNKIGKVLSNGESKSLRKYSFTDTAPVAGENLYRLRMVDKDLTFAFSSIRSVKFDGAPAELSVYPNPVTDKLFIRDFNNVSQVMITDINGRAVYRSGATTTGQIAVNNLSTGMYLVKITRSNGVMSSQKIVVGK